MIGPQPWPPVSELSDAVGRGAATATSIVTEAVERQSAIDHEIHAFCTPTTDLALEAAAAIDAHVAADLPVGRLAGVPYGVKDLICTKGVRTTSGSVAYRDFVPDEDDIVVERCSAAGAISLGKTNASEFGYSATGTNPLFPTTRNPLDTRLTPGGSSAGSAAAVAAGIVPFALGSDGGGSIRIPAAFTSLVGFKPSMGRVPVYPGCRDPRHPGVSGWESIEHIGPICRTVEDVCSVMAVLAGPDPRDRHTIPSGDVDWDAIVPGLRRDPSGARDLQVAFSMDFGYLAVDREVRTAIEQAVSRLADTLSWSVNPVDPGWSEPGDEFTALIMSETDLVGMRRMVDEIGDQMSPHLVGMLRRGWSAEDFTGATMWRKSIVNRMAALMGGHDILITPTTCVPPFEVDVQGPTVIDGRQVSDTAWQGFTFVANLTGQPAISVPVGRTRDGLPVGMQIVGRHLGDAAVLRVAAACESILADATGSPDVHMGERARLDLGARHA